jgi:hypothetical protein
MTDNNNPSRLQRVSKILNYIGATLIFFGITYWLSFNWNFLAAISRVVLTLGAAAWTLYIAASLTADNKHPTSSGALFMLGGLLLPIGISVTINAFGVNFTHDIVKMITPSICFAVFLVLELRYNREILLLFSILYGSLFFLTGINFLNDNGVWFPGDSLISYQALVLGACYILLAYGLSYTKSSLTGCLCIVGDLLILLASFYLAGLFFAPSDNFFWEILTPSLLLASFLLYVPFQNKMLLCISTVFLVIYISRLTYRYSYIFGNLEWPLVLIVAGVVLMVAGFVLVGIQKNISKKTSRARIEPPESGL